MWEEREEKRARKKEREGEERRWEKEGNVAARYTANGSTMGDIISAAA